MCIRGPGVAAAKAPWQSPGKPPCMLPTEGAGGHSRVPNIHLQAGLLPNQVPNGLGHLPNSVILLIPGPRHVARAAEPRHNSPISGLGMPSPEIFYLLRSSAVPELSYEFLTANENLVRGPVALNLRGPSGGYYTQTLSTVVPIL